MSKTRKLTISGLVIALYVVIMTMTAEFSFGVYQIRIATSLYSLSYLFPFLVVPLGISNFLSNMLLGGLGLMDIFGGTFVGIITSFFVYLVRKFNLNKIFIVPIIIAGPGLIVPIWLSLLYSLPYPAVALSLCIGQIIPAVLGWVMVCVLEKSLNQYVLEAR